MTPTTADNLLLFAGTLAGGGVVAQFWIWSTGPVNRDSYFAVALLFASIAVLAYFEMSLP